MKAFAHPFHLLPLIIYCSGCGQYPRVDVTPGIEDGRVVFKVVRSGMNGLLRFAVADGTNILWEVSTSYEQGKRIVYGVLPTGGNMKAKQIVPTSGVPPVPIEGKVVKVSVDYQYDRPFAPSVGHFVKTMQIPTAEPIGRAEPPPSTPIKPTPHED